MQSTAPGSPPASPAAPGRQGRASCPLPGTEVASGLLCHHPCSSSIAPRRVPGKFFLFSLPNLRSLPGSCLLAGVLQAGISPASLPAALFFSASSHLGVSWELHQDLSRGRTRDLPRLARPFLSEDLGKGGPARRGLRRGPPARSVVMGLELCVPG